MKDINTSIVIPLYNEKDSIAELLTRIRSVVKKGQLGNTECVFIDDGSRDGSFEKIKMETRDVSFSVTRIRFRKNMGKSAALACGFAHAKGVRIITMDADLQDDPDDIPAFLTKLDEGYDMVVGWRRERRDAWQKKALSRVFNAVVRTVSKIDIHDFNIGLKAYRREVISEIHLYGQLHRFIPVLAAARGFSVGEVPVHHHARKHGTSKFGSRRIISAAFDLIATLFLLTFKRQPLQLFGSTGIISLGAGFVILLYLTYLRFLGETIGRRPLLFLGVLLLLFGGQLISTGLLAELITSYNYHKDTYPIEEIVTT